MNDKYIVAIMNLKKIGEMDFIFYCDHVAIGRIDESTDTFIDDNGMTYVPMLSPAILEQNVSQVYFNVLKMDDVKKQMGPNYPVHSFLKSFEEKVKSNIYFLGKGKGDKLYFATFDKDKILNDENIPKEYDTSYEEEEKVKYTIDDYNANYSINLQLEQLLGEILDGNYSISDYEGILKDLNDSLNTMDKITNAMSLHSSKTVPAISRKKEEIIEEKENKSQKIDIDDIYNKVTKTLIAQDDPARRVIVEIARKEMDVRKKKEGILLTGPTGIGKTELMRLIAKYIDRPFLKIDSTQLTMPGYVGKDIEEVLWDLYIRCGKDLEKTEKAIIFFDEIDKKGSSKKSDPSGKGVLNVLLSFIEGTTYDACANVKYPTEVVKIDTSNMTVILGGAYSEVYKNADKHDLGFLKGESSESKEQLMSTKNFVDYGMMSDEFMSRVTVVKLNELDVNAIKRIMLESDESAIKIQQEIFEKLGVKLTFTDGYTTAVAKNAYDKKTGARGLNGIIDESTWKAFEDVYSHPNTYEEVILDEKVLESPENYQYIKKNS